MRSVAIVQIHSRTQSSSAHDGQGERELTRGVRSVSTGVEIACKPRKERVFLIFPTPLPLGQDRLKQIPTPGPEGLDLTQGLPKGKVTGQIEPCITWC